MKERVKAKIKGMSHEEVWDVNDAPVDMVSFKDGTACIHKLIDGKFDRDAWYILKDYANRLSVVGFFWYKNGTEIEYKICRGGAD